MMRASPWCALALAAALSGCGASGGPDPRFTVSGQVLDADGLPLAGAVVSDGRISTLSDDNGRFSLGVYGEQVVAIKPGFKRAETSVAQATTLKLRLVPAAGAPRLGIDTRSGAHVSGLRGYLAGDGNQVFDYPARPLSGLDVLLMVTPGGLSGAELERIKGWVRQGGRLILCGEWGGYPAQDLAGLNALAGDAGLRFTGATVKTTTAGADNEEWFTLPGPAPAALAAQVGNEGLYLFTCTSLALSGSARTLFQSSRQAYSVLATTGPQTLAGVGPSGYGKVFALGDSSLWLDEDSALIGTPNWQRGANRKLASALVQW